jgi:hypothetical protein
MARKTTLGLILTDLRSRQHLDTYLAIVIGLVLAVLGMLRLVRIET